MGDFRPQLSHISKVEDSFVLQLQPHMIAKVILKIINFEIIITLPITKGM